MLGSKQEDHQAKPDKIITHDDFDGVVSAALCSLAEGIDRFRFTGPGAILDSGLGIDQDSIVCDLPHHPAARLWFDHHVGNLEDYCLKGGDPQQIQGAFAEEKSCARVIYSYYLSKEIVFPEYMAGTVKEADIIDSFDYKDIDDWQKETPGKLISDTLRIFFRTRRERNEYMAYLIRKIRGTPLENLLEDQQVQEKIKIYREVEKKNYTLMEKLCAFLPEDNEHEIIIIDTTGMKHAVNLIKSLAFVLFPEAKAVLEIRSLFQKNRKTNDIAFSMSLSPEMGVGSSAKDVGEIMRSLNMGDGHRGAGAGRISCKSKAEMLKQKAQIINEIVDMWKAQGAASNC